MHNPSRTWTDRRIETIIGDLLRAGVIFSGAIVLIGGIVYLIRQGNTAPHYGVFHGEPSDLRSVRALYAMPWLDKGAELSNWGFSS